MKKRHFKKYIAPYASSDNQFRRDPNFQIFKLQIFGGSFTLYKKRGAHKEPQAWINKREKDNLIKLVFKYKIDLYLIDMDE